MLYLCIIAFVEQLILDSYHSWQDATYLTFAFYEAFTFLHLTDMHCLFKRHSPLNITKSIHSHAYWSSILHKGTIYLDFLGAFNAVEEKIKLHLKFVFMAQKLNAQATPCLIKITIAFHIHHIVYIILKSGSFLLIFTFIARAVAIHLDPSVTDLHWKKRECLRFCGSAFSHLYSKWQQK